MPLNDEAPKLGRVILEARKALGLTLAQLSERSGVSRSMLSAIERDTVNPTFSVVWALTQALGVDLSSITEAAEHNDLPIEHMHSYSTPKKQSADGLVELSMLNPRRSSLPVEWHDLQLQKGGRLDSKAHAPSTFEHLTCTEGCLALTVGGRRVSVSQGDTLRYAADQPHVIENQYDGPSRGILVVVLPEQFSSH